MNKQFFIVMGRSGSGKGTQADLLKAYLEKKGIQSVKHFTTGGHFRDFVTKDSYISHLSRAVNEQGGLQPEFLAVWNWATIFIDELVGGESIILDGAPRKVFEIDALHSAISFMGFEKPIVVYIDVSEGWAMDKLTSRGRADDASTSDQEHKMEWFNTDVLPVLAQYKDDPRYNYIHVNGEQDIEGVHEELVSKLELL